MAKLSTEASEFKFEMDKAKAVVKARFGGPLAEA